MTSDMPSDNPLTELLRPHVSALKSDAAAGDGKAKQVIDLYRLHCSAPQDPGAPALCRAAFDEWIRRRRRAPSGST